MLDCIILALDAPFYRDENNYQRKKHLAYRPLGPYKISWIARKHGYRALTISRLQLLSEQEIIELIEPLINSKTVIGVSTAFIQPPLQMLIDKNYEDKLSTRELFKLRTVVEALRAKHNNKVVVGGSVGQIFHDFFRADQSFSGEAENAIVKYLDQHFRSGIQKKPYDWNIQSCDFRWHESDCVQTNEVLPLEMSRGCMFKCKFCAWEMIGKKRGTYERNISALRDELIYNYEHFNTTSYILASDTINEDNQRMNEWCDMLESLPFRIRYTGFARLDLAYTNPHITRRLYETGLSGVHFGVETFNYDAAKSIGKGFSAKHGKQALEYIFYDLFQKNVAINVTMIVGLPGENSDSIYSSVNWFQSHPKIHVGFFPLQLANPALVPEHYTLSEFSKNILDYGYSFSDHAVNWKNDIMEWKDAVNICYDIMNYKIQTNTLESWSSIMYLNKSQKPPNYFITGNTNQLISKLAPEIEQDNQNYFLTLKKYIEKFPFFD